MEFRLADRSKDGDLMQKVRGRDRFRTFVPKRGSLGDRVIGRFAIAIKSRDAKTCRGGSVPSLIVEKNPPDARSGGHESMLLRPCLVHTAPL